MSSKSPTSVESLGSGDVAPWTQARKLLAEARFYWLATVHPEGQPHARPVLAVWWDGTLFFSAREASRKGRNLAKNPHCSVTVESEIAHLVVEGKASIVSDESRLREVAAVYAAKYGWEVDVQDGAFYGNGAPTAGPPPYKLYELTPTRVLGFGADVTFNPTIWHF